MSDAVSKCVLSQPGPDHVQSELLSRTDGSPSSLESAVGRLAFKALHAEGLLLSAEKLLHEEPLLLPEALSLAKASFPLLGKLVELALSRRRSSLQQTVVVRPCVLLPLAHWIETSGFVQAEEEANERLRRCLRQLPWEGPISVVVDRWAGKFALGELSALLARVVAAGSVEWEVVPIGPSTAEVRSLLERSGREIRHGVGVLLDTLKEAGIHSIEGGGDLDIHVAAAERGFCLAVGYALRGCSSRVRKEEEVAHPEGELIKALFAVRDTIVPQTSVHTWFPFGFATLDQAEELSDGPLGLEVLRAIALARLILPEVPNIRASVSFLGPKVAQLALSFGANDLGFAAIDNETATALGIARLSDTLKLATDGNPFPHIVKSREEHTPWE